MATTAWAAGQRITADRLNAITPIWQTWTPTWSTSTGNNTPDIGNGTFNCAYARTGDTITANFDVIFGSTTDFNSGTGSDNWLFTLPVTAAGVFNSVGMVELTQSGSARAAARIRLASTTTFEFEVSSGRVDASSITNNGLVDAISPWTWASGNAIRGVLIYEAA